MYAYMYVRYVRGGVNGIFVVTERWNLKDWYICPTLFFIRREAEELDQSSVTALGFTRVIWNHPETINAVCMQERSNDTLVERCAERIEATC